MRIFETEMINYLRLLLFPFSIVYGLIILIRNKCYDWGWFKSQSFDMPVICVGNLVVGGSGKTPVTEYLVDLLADYKIAILSRGYGRKTNGFILADPSATALTIGDEPMQYYRKFPQVTVAVCEDRVKGITQLQGNHDLILLDDAFQHRRVRPGFNILLFEYHKLLKTQFLLPAGNLREHFSGYKRAQAILVTKTPASAGDAQRQALSKRFDQGWVPAFSALQYQDLIHLYTSQSMAMAKLPVNTVVYLLTGIANPAPLVGYLKSGGTRVIHHDYADHHAFTSTEISRLAAAFRQDKSTEKIIITTEKDAQRLSAAGLQELLVDLPVYFLPIKINILAKDKLTFDQNVINYVSSYTRNRTTY
ncbi:tetraacyldisaccharide 4'-kinase [Pedobacter sp. CAN_A7]|uniref:tetraacyldisaccharide 4'-kinase n=1 Tax=Pedobacter sp. CAN_A7 TaxID=2787722 RepID=UPI001A21F32C